MSRTISSKSICELLGPGHHSTLSASYNLAEIELEGTFLDKATEWCQWVSDGTQRVFGTRHVLSMKTESLMAEIMCQRGQYQEAESMCANVLARQQMNIGEDHLDTLTTRRRLAMAYNALSRRENAIATAEKLADSYKRLLGDNHVLFFVAALDMLEYAIYNHGDNGVNTKKIYRPDVKRAFEIIPTVHEELLAGLGRIHPLTIRALCLHGRGLICVQEKMEASETLRRALAVSEEALGPDHPLTMDIVGNIAVMYALQAPQYYVGSSPPSEALPWLKQYVEWVERRRGIQNPETLATLEMLANLQFVAKEYESAQKYFERAMASCRGNNPAAEKRIDNLLQLCRANTMWTTGNRRSGMEGILSAFQRQRF